MALSGKLEVFPLEEVLRLLARSHQSGCLRVEGQGAGRIYLEGGSMTYAAVEPDEALRSHLIAAGLVTEAGLSGIDLSNGALTEAMASGASTSALGDVIREQCVESVYRIRRPQEGPFTFTVETRPRYATGQSYDIEMVISEADRRAAEWADIEEEVADLSTPWHMVATIDEESVKLSDVAWRFLAALEGASSVKDLSHRLGLNDFHAARRMAELARARLVEPVTVAQPTMATPAFESSVLASEPWDKPLQSPAVEDSASAARWTAQPSAVPAAEPAAIETEVVEPSTTEDELTAPAASDGQPVERSWWEEPVLAEADQTAAEETEPDDTFLEAVFGELEADEKTEGSDDTVDGEGGFGLLRRRGLGAAFRELADS